MCTLKPCRWPEHLLRLLSTGIKHVLISLLMMFGAAVKFFQLASILLMDVKSLKFVARLVALLRLIFSTWLLECRRSLAIQQLVHIFSIYSCLLAIKENYNG